MGEKKNRNPGLWNYPVFLEGGGRGGVGNIFGEEILSIFFLFGGGG